MKKEEKEQCPQGFAATPRTINVDNIKELPYAQRQETLRTRAEWLKKSRQQDKKEANRTNNRIRMFKKYKHYIPLGLCPFCKEHKKIYKNTRCKHCYQNTKNKDQGQPLTHRPRTKTQML